MNSNPKFDGSQNLPSFDDYKDLIETGGADIIQADATRCGTTNFFKSAGVCDFFRIPFSAHTAPSLHTHLCCLEPAAINVEYFHDQVRIKNMLVDGAISAEDGWLSPDLSKPGNGLELRSSEAEEFKIC